MRSPRRPVPLPKHYLAAGALASLAGHRREAFWHVTGIEPLPPVLENARFDEAPVALTPSSEGEDLVADYTT